jgi:hypothetical protein
MTEVPGDGILSYNLVILKTENAKLCVMLAIFTSITEALHDTKHGISKTS